MSVTLSVIKNSQRGAVLLVSLIFLLLLTIIGVGAMRSGILQERMAGNFRDLNTAFQAAEGAVRAAERYLDGENIGPFTDAGGLYAHCDDVDSCSLPDWRERDSDPNPWQSREGSMDGMSRQAEYIIQHVKVEWDVAGGSVEVGETLQYRDFYQITARGFGASDRTMVVLQTMYKRDD